MKRVLFILGMSLLVCQYMWADSISGIVTKKGKPRRGVTVWLKLADKSIETDKEGRFIFANASPEDTLCITAGTRADARIPVGEKQTIVVDLDKNDFSVNDGQSEERFKYTMLPLPKSSDGVTHEMIMRSGLRSVADILRNYMTGVQVSTDGGTTKVLIHGVSSINSSTEPLVVLDGMGLQGADIENLVPVEEIALIRVVKDGSGYGVRGANGVIEITTRGYGKQN